MMLKMVARLLSEGIAHKNTGLIMRGVVPPLSRISWCAQGQLNVKFIRLF